MANINPNLKPLPIDESLRKDNDKIDSNDDDFSGFSGSGSPGSSPVDSSPVDSSPVDSSPDNSSGSGNGDNSSGDNSQFGNGHYSIDPDTALSAIWRELFGMLAFGSSNYSAFDMLNGTSYLDVLQNVLERVNTIFDDLDLDSDFAGAQLEFLEKVANVAHSYLDNMFNQLLNYQAWYLQQEYNTPLNQLKRLEEAGLSSAFIFGGYSNTASSPSASGGSGSNPALSSLSGAGQAVTSERNSKREARAALFGTLADTSVNLINAGINSHKTLAEADNIRQLTPLQLQNAVRDFENKGILGQYMQTQANTMESTDFRNWFNDIHERAGKEVDRLQTAYNSAISDETAKKYGSFFVDEQVYTGKVNYRNGEQRFHNFSREELEDSVANGGYTKDGGRIDGFDKFDVGVNFNGKHSFGVKPIQNNEFQYGVDFKYQHGKTTSKYDENGTNYNIGRHSLNEIGRYYDNGNGFQIGNTNFRITTERKRVDSDEYKKFMSDAQDRLVNAQQRYNMLTDDDKGFWLRSYDSYLKNYSYGIKQMLKRQFDNALFRNSTPSNQQPVNYMSGD